MALQPLQALRPFGQFDGLDSEVTSTLGGEVATLTYVSISGSDSSAADADDGYLAPADTRPAVTISLSSGDRPLFLCDDGQSGYGTLFGEVVGAATGQTATGGAQLGPHTATGSGKTTLWNYPGMYAITLDAADTTENSGLVPTNPALTGADPLYATSAGLLTPNAGAAFEAVVVARFIEFAPQGSLVTTPLGQVQAQHSPVGASDPGAQFDVAIINWGPELS